MRRGVLQALAVGMAGWMAAGCSGNGDPAPGAPEVKIRNEAWKERVATGESARLRAEVVNGVEAEVEWLVDGTEAGRDSVLVFEKEVAGQYEVVARAWNEDGTGTDEVVMEVVEGFGMEEVRKWAGTGKKRAVMAVQWVREGKMDGEGEMDREEEVLFLAWGVRWQAGEGETGMDMVRAVAEMDPRLFVLVRESELGTVVLGFGYDGNGDGRIEVREKGGEGGDGEERVVLREGDFERGMHDAGVSGVDPDRLEVVSEGDWWMSGWETRYLSYWCHEGEWVTGDDDFEYAQRGASARVLEDGSWDVWTCSTVNEGEVNTVPKTGLLQAAE